MVERGVRAEEGRVSRHPLRVTMSPFQRPSGHLAADVGDHHAWSVVNLLAARLGVAPSAKALRGDVAGLALRSHESARAKEGSGNQS